MVAGGLVISLGAAAGGGALTTVLATIGPTLLLEAQFDLCLAAPLLGYSTDGSEIRKQASLTAGAPRRRIVTPPAGARTAQWPR